MPLLKWHMCHVSSLVISQDWKIPPLVSEIFLVCILTIPPLKGMIVLQTCNGYM